jgi:hypothetical protein
MTGVLAVWSRRIGVRALIVLGCGLAAMWPVAARAATGDPPANRTLSQTTLQACHTNPAEPCRAARPRG